ncbi:MAG TPA: hypothetical protein VHX65_09815 [Pirellulales bacterium]|nr:hypothetical protein [Pirellulales bacterium]
MSIGPAGFYSIIAATSPQTSALAAPLAQSQASDIDRTAQEVAQQARETDVRTKAENAAGVGQADAEEHESNERDADGRRLWEKPPGSGDNADAEESMDPAAADASASHPSHVNRDASGESGNQLDLMG